MKVWKAKQEAKNAAADSSDESATEAEPPKKPAAKKRKKDPLKPKQGKTAYNFYMEENRERLEKENPDVDYNAIVSLSSCCVMSRVITCVLTDSRHCL